MNVIFFSFENCQFLDIVDENDEKHYKDRGSERNTIRAEIFCNDDSAEHNAVFVILFYAIHIQATTIQNTTCTGPMPLFTSNRKKAVRQNKKTFFLSFVLIAEFNGHLAKKILGCNATELEQKRFQERNKTTMLFKCYHLKTAYVTSTRFSSKNKRKE